eukprot:TRINITY_DN5255_c0_g1_i1.p1 TRINITY_DN5255_c0_g1~~TRINITY_DN5255_c0_g1_i1.p1  ORF type:complete len:328 (-),score=51.28 TRINITY_DN5255_c0_g1_i1:23-1006(-)
MLIPRYLTILFVFFLCVSAYEDNYALSFDGEDDIVRVGHLNTDLLLSDSWTLEAWVKPFGDQKGHFQPNIIGFPGRHPNLEFCGTTTNTDCDNPTKTLTQLREKDGNYYTVVGNKTLDTDNKWYHLAATWDNVTLSLYIDGELDISIKPYQHGYNEPLGCYFELCDEGLDIGGYRFLSPQGTYYNNQYFKGIIDEVRVWRVGRTQSEIKKFMNQVLSGAEPGLLYYWPFDEGTGTLVSSIAEVGYGALGGGILTAEPRWVRSDAPLIFSYRTKPGHSNSSAIYVTAGFMSVVFFLIGAIVGVVLHRRFGNRNPSQYFGVSQVTTEVN